MTPQQPIPFDHAMFQLHQVYNKHVIVGQIWTLPGRKDKSGLAQCSCGKWQFAAGSPPHHACELYGCWPAAELLNIYPAVYASLKDYWVTMAIPMYRAMSWPNVLAAARRLKTERKPEPDSP